VLHKPDNKSASYRGSWVEVGIKWNQQGLSEHLPDAETLGLTPNVSFYESLAFAIGVLIQQGFELPKEKQEVIAEIQKDILVDMGVINERGRDSVS